MNAADLPAPAQTTDEVKESLEVNGKGQVLSSIKNCKTVFANDPLLKGAVCYNLLTERVDIVKDLGWRRNTRVLTDTDMKYLLLYFEETYGLTSEKKVAAALTITANENCYHPIQDRLEGLVWDGQPRIRFCLHHFLGAEVSDYVEEMFRHFLLGAVRRVFSPGCKYEENMYQNVVNDILCHPDDKPTIGLLLVKGKNKTVVEYSLYGYQNPIGVAEWKNQLTKALPEELKRSLPTIEEIEKELER